MKSNGDLTTTGRGTAGTESINQRLEGKDRNCET